MKGNWNTALREHAANNINKPMKKSLFLQLFMPVWNKTANIKYAQEGFKKAGLIPFKSTNVDTSQLISERRV